MLPILLLGSTSRSIKATLITYHRCLMPSLSYTRPQPRYIKPHSLSGCKISHVHREGRKAPNECYFLTRIKRVRDAHALAPRDGITDWASSTKDLRGAYDLFEKEEIRIYYVVDISMIKIPSFRRNCLAQVVRPPQPIQTSPSYCILTDDCIRQR